MPGWWSIAFGCTLVRQNLMMQWRQMMRQASHMITRASQMRTQACQMITQASQRMRWACQMITQASQRIRWACQMMRHCLLLSWSQMLGQMGP
eukprot:8605853-Karenia_brevis.AAC.1